MLLWVECEPPAIYPRSALPVGRCVPIRFRRGGVVFNFQTISDRMTKDPL